MLLPMLLAIATPIDCQASVDNALRCAHALYVAHQPNAAADVLTAIYHPCCNSGPEMRVNKGVHTEHPWTDGFMLDRLAWKYRQFANDLRVFAESDPRKSYWPLAQLRKTDLELGGAYAPEIWARLREVAPAAANLYAKGKTRDDCIDYPEPAAMARELGMPVDPPAKRCRHVRQ